MTTTKKPPLPTSSSMTLFAYQRLESALKAALDLDLFSFGR